MRAMRHRIFWMIIVGVPLALIVVAAGTAAAFPVVRHIVSALWNLPDRLPSLPENSQVHFEPGADDYAHDVSALLPAAIARVEAAQGRPFAHPVTLGVYATPEAYVAANGQGTAQFVGVTAFGRVYLSPVLNWPQHRRLRAILTHELSHAHIQGWISANGFLHLPPWFKEGLAVMVSGGGGAEFVSEEEARAAIDRGECIAIVDAGSLSTFEVGYERAPQGTPSHLTVMAYRQAGMFVTYLHDSDTPGFARMMNAILDGRSFAEAVAAGYQQDVHSLWQKFVQASN
jgi:peptidase MA superfamily protein